MSEQKVLFAMGNQAITEGAIAAGARFYAGYPITPSSEIAELSSVRLPQVGGMYVQMEDELGSIAAIIGASVAGKKSYTATSGPGFSLMQENLGVAIMGEIPCVIINVMRVGPSTGAATKPAQGDVMQSRWGTHGDHGIIVLSPASVQECYDLTIKAFNFAEKYRTPVILLADEVVGHMRERYTPWTVTEADIVDRACPCCDPVKYQPYSETEIAPLAAYGSEYVFRISGTMHDNHGDGSIKPECVDHYVRHAVNKLEEHKDDICVTKQYRMDDAEYAIITFGCSVRSAQAAMRRMRAKGIKVGVLQLVTLWPFPDAAVEEVMGKVKAVAVPEMNLGQIIHEVGLHNPKQIPVIGVNRVDTEMITPYEIEAAFMEVAE